MRKTCFLTILLALFASGCGYALQNSKSVLLEKEGIRRVYVAPLTNNTFKAGVENLIYNALVKSIASHRRVVLVTRREDADAILSGIVNDASSSTVASQPASGLYPIGLAGNIYKDTFVTSIYQATINCS